MKWLDNKATLSEQRSLVFIWASYELCIILASLVGLVYSSVSQMLSFVIYLFQVFAQ